MLVPQRPYIKSGHNPPKHPSVVLFARDDGSYIPVTAALREDYVGLMNRDTPALDEAGFTFALRFEVNRPYRLRSHASTHRSHSGQGIRPKVTR